MLLIAVVSTEVASCSSVTTAQSGSCVQLNVLVPKMTITSWQESNYFVSTAGDVCTELASKNCMQKSLPSMVCERNVFGTQS